jgi:DNA-binding IclR family transcriptional regulator
MKEKNVEKSSSIDKALIVLRQLCKEPYKFTMTELAKKTEINRTTIYRILNTLEDKGLVIKTKDNKQYKLGPFAYEMGSIYLNNFRFKDSIYPILDKISHETKESVGFAVIDGEKVISLYEIEIDQPMKMNYRPGINYPINRGCYGKCLMAYYDQDRVKEILKNKVFEQVCENTITDKEELLKEYERIRQQGYVVSINETFPFAVGVGVPIRNTSGEVKACVAIAFFKREDYKEKLENMKKVLLKYQDEISKYMI